MPVFGKSLFETVLEGLGEPVEEDEEDLSPPVRGFNGGFVGRDWSAKPEIDIDPSLLFDGFPPDPIAIEPVIPDWLGRLSDSEIVEDLALGDCRTEQDFRDRRRLFALSNHPDRVPAEYCDQATHRMMVANQLIDRALARFR
jgi:hypothetical protein